MLTRIRLNQIQSDGGVTGNFIRYNGSNWVATSIVSSDITDFSESVDDRVNSLILEGTGIITTYNDGANTLTIDVDTSIVATNSNSLTFTNKTLTSPIINTPTIIVNDNVFTIQDDGDTTKKAKFELSSIATSTTRTYTLPNANGTVALTSDLSGISPSGSTGNIQFNSGSSTFAANSNISIDTGNTKMIIGTTIGASAADAILDLVSTTKGFLPPRMTTSERNAISSPSNGLIIYNSTTNRITIRENSEWIEPTNFLISSFPSADLTSSGIKITLTANENQTAGDACFINSSGKAQIGDADAIATASCVALCIEDVVTNATGTYLLHGFFRKNSWNWTVGGTIYLSTTGTTTNTLTHTAPSGTDDVIQVLGMAVHADCIYFKPELTQVELN